MSVIIIKFIYCSLDFLSKIDEGRTVVRTVLLANAFSTVNGWRGTDDDFLGNLTEDWLVLIVGIWNARNGPVIVRDWLFDLEEIKWISSRTCAVEILRDTAQRWIFRLRLLLVDIDRRFSIDTARLILIFSWSLKGIVWLFEADLVSLTFDWLPKPSSNTFDSVDNSFESFPMIFRTEGNYK